MARNEDAKPKDESPVQPLETSTAAPSQPENTQQTQKPDNSKELEEALARAAAAEKRADEAEKAAEEAEAAKVDAQKGAADAEKAAEKAQTALQEASQPDDPPQNVTQVPDDFKDKEGNDLCWNCKNHGHDRKLDSAGTCKHCGFVKDKLYNGNIEADKASARMAAQIYQ